MPSLRRRSAGVLLHPTSLPGPFGVGDLGPEAHAFLDFLAEARQTWWQMLPVGPSGVGHSPYSALSAFAGETLLISLDRLVDDGLLPRKRLKAPKRLSKGPADFEAAEAFRHDALQEAWEEFRRAADSRSRAALAAFADAERGWLDEYALFRALRHERRNAAWWTWEKEVRAREPRTLEDARGRLADRLDFERFAQWRFHGDWESLREGARRRGIGLIGDIPIFVARDSAEVWSSPELFWLGSEGEALKVAGVPPDYFAKDGQLWGNPLYRWDLLRERGYRWWIERLRAALSRFDAVRIDHFIGFHNYWEIPGTATTAREGRWVPGPGADFFERIFAELGEVQLIAEDLGAVTEGVRALRDRFRLPGMRVLQFAFGDDEASRLHQPHRHPPGCVAYTGTHDNDTTVGWWKDRGSKSSTRGAEQIRRERAFALRYLGSDGREIHWDMIRAALGSPADTAIIPAQDLLGLGTSARMNLPGVPEGNWGWRLARRLPASVASRLRAMTETFERAP